jgi:hypothetical protein
LHKWYQVLDKYVNYSSSVKTTLVRTALDQGLFSPCGVFMFYSVLGTMEGRSPENIKQRLKEVLYIEWLCCAFSLLTRQTFVPEVHRDLDTKLQSMANRTTGQFLHGPFAVPTVSRQLHGGWLELLSQLAKCQIKTKCLFSHFCYCE